MSRLSLPWALGLQPNGFVVTPLSPYVVSPEETADSAGPMIDALIRVMATRDRGLLQHARRVQGHALALAAAASITDVRMLAAIETAALLHDIGKLGIPDRLLDKPSPLTADEYDLVRQHVTIGADILSLVPFPGPVALIVRHHHENWDGTGYPDGLRGQAIPVAGRVLAIADCYDALTSDRPYRRAHSQDFAAALICQQRGTMYDPKLTDAFLRIIARPRAAVVRASDDRRQTRPRGPRLLEGRVG